LHSYSEESNNQIKRWKREEADKKELTCKKIMQPKNFKITTSFVADKSREI
jgi:hypothetical protein